MKQKIGIITLYYQNHNYGGLLQSYALQKAVEKLGFECEQISYQKDDPKKSIPYYIKRIFDLRPSTVIEMVKTVQNTKKQSKLLDEHTREQLKLRNAMFETFIQEIPHSKVYSEQTISECCKKYDGFICGSDQIWSPDWWRPAFFLDFVPDERFKMSYAASVGKPVLTKRELHKIVPWLKSFNKITVREQQAKDILQESVAQEIKVVLDPTLLLSQEDWAKIETPVAMKEDYCFVYLLGQNESNIQLIKKVKAAMNIKIVTLPYINFNSPGDYADELLYEVGPREFVSLIKNAKLVITDSFHASVFSIIHQKDFYVLDRSSQNSKNSMNSRLSHLLSQLGLEDRSVNAANPNAVISVNQQIDYNMVNQNLAVLKEDSLHYLKNSLQILNQESKGE